MSPRNALRRASAAAAALALTAVALVWAPSAAVAADSQGCAYFNGLTATATNVYASQLAFNGGEVIKVTAPATIQVYYGGGGFSYNWDDVDNGTFTIPATGTYNIQFYTEPSKTVTWTFSCGTGTGSITTQPPAPVATADADKDGVADSIDRCASTALPDRFSKPVAGRYGVNSASRFVDGKGAASTYTITSTKGCSAAQIIAARKLGKTDQRSGITLSTLQSWVTSVS